VTFQDVSYDTPRPSGPIGILLYDLRASGVTRNAIRIGLAARMAGLDARLWPVRPQGDLLDMVPSELPVEPIRDAPTERQRDVDCALSSWPMRIALAARRPAIVFSAGNQMHVHLARVAGPPEARSYRFVGRASNAIASAGSAWRAPLRPIERFQYGAMDRIVAVSEELGAGLVGQLGQVGTKVRVIPNGVDVDAIRTRALAPLDHPFLADDGVPRLLAVGRASRQKNFEGLIRAFAIARLVRPMRLLILAPGSLSARDRLRALAADLGVGADVAIESFAANPFAFMARADLFVLSSLWEGASNVLLEALACGCPVVAARAPTGVAEVMMDGALGPLAPPGDDPALAQAILARLARPRDEATLVARARDYDLGRTLAAYVDLLGAELALARRERVNGNAMCGFAAARTSQLEAAE
jgi:glycosyltransferase involved in cell wall biosynthesis